jgi:hypothetical protein
LKNLIEFIRANSGAVENLPFAHVDMVFMIVGVNTAASPVAMRALIEQSRSGEFCNCDPLDGAEHNFMELGGWLGDQGLALQFMALGFGIGMWELLTPRRLLGSTITNEVARGLAGRGMIAIVADGKPRKALKAGEVMP